MAGEAHRPGKCPIPQNITDMSSKRAASEPEPALAPVRKTVRADDPAMIQTGTEVYVRPHPRKRGKAREKLNGKHGKVLGSGMSVHGVTEYEVELDGSLETMEHSELLQRVVVELTE